MFELVPEWASHYEEFWLTIRKRNLWFIKLRYGAVVMLLISIFFPKYIFDVDLSDDQQKALLLITFSILFYNSSFILSDNFLSIAENFNPLHLSILQMIFDLFALMLVIYLPAAWNHLTIIFCNTHDCGKLNFTGICYLYFCRCNSDCILGNIPWENITQLLRIIMLTGFYRFIYIRILTMYLH